MEGFVGPEGEEELEDLQSDGSSIGEDVDVQVVVLKMCGENAKDSDDERGWLLAQLCAEDLD